MKDNYLAIDEVNDLFEVQVDSITVTPRVAAVRLELRLGDNSYFFTGEALRSSHDRFDREVALKLAYGRALERAAARMLHQANGKVKHNDDVREMRAAARAKPKHKPLPTEVNVRLRAESPAAVKARRLGADPGGVLRACDLGHDSTEPVTPTTTKKPRRRTATKA